MKRAPWQTVQGSSPLVTRRRADRHGNRLAREGCDRCYCGCKYWKRDACIDCGTRIEECLRDPDWREENREPMSRTLERYL